MHIASSQESLLHGAVYVTTPVSTLAKINESPDKIGNIMLNMLVIIIY